MDTGSSVFKCNIDKVLLIFFSAFVGGAYCSCFLIVVAYCRYFLILVFNYYAMCTLSVIIKSVNINGCTVHCAILVH